MRLNSTQFRKFDAGHPKTPVIKKSRKRTASNISADYTIMLQLYCISREQAEIKKDLKYGKALSSKSSDLVSKSSYSAISTLMSFFTVTFSFNKKLKQGIALITG